MKNSGRVKSNTEKSTDSILQHAQSMQLDDDTFELLVNKYKEMFPDFANIYNEYSAYVKRQKNSRNNKLCVLDFDKWVPSFLQEHCNAKSFQYPVNVIRIHKQITVETDITFRLISYTSSNLTKQGGSYVRIIGGDVDDKLLKLGQIEMCFSHTFDTTATIFASIHIFKNPQQDVESNLWWVPLKQDNITKAVLPISSLSYPLGFAEMEDENKIWFLTIS